MPVTRMARTMTASTTLVLVVLVSSAAAQSTPEPVSPAVHDASVSAGTQTRPKGWAGALRGSMNLLAMEHVGRIAFQEKTRRELSGPFFPDYARSVKRPHGWNDGDGWFVNYVGHPIHGAASSRIWLDQVESDRHPTFGMTKAYFASRGKAAAWAAGYSLQFEFGPLSEASIGNVGMNPATTGWVDHIVTPVGALAMTVAEDALDQYLITLIERHTRNAFFTAAVRIFFNPSRSLANVAQGREPWFRATRPMR
jgi:hypothetical protein